MKSVSHYETAIETMETADEQEEIRTALKREQSGRWYNLLSAGHSMFAHMDLSNRDLFAAQNPIMLRWFRVYGILEDLNPFEHYVDEHTEINP